MAHKSASGKIISRRYRVLAKLHEISKEDKWIEIERGEQGKKTVYDVPYPEEEDL